MAIREGRWDCQYCGAIGNFGRDRACNNCGKSRPEGTKFYLADDAEVTDKRLLRQAQIGPDWICEFCGTSNAADKHICGSCNAPRADTTPDQEIKEYAPGEAPDSGDMTFDDEPQPAAEAETKPRSKASASAILIGIGAIIVLCIGIVIAFVVFGGSSSEARVAGFEWQRSLEVEAFQTVTEEDWTVPQGGRIVDQRQDIHHYDQILDHYEPRQREVPEQVQVGERTFVCGQRDLGNGFFEDIQCTEPVYETQYRTETYDEPIYRQEPVYQTLYTYDIDKWDTVRVEEASGRDHSPFWPRADLGENEREGQRSERYVIIFTDGDEKSYQWETSFDEWQRYEQGQSVTLKIDAFGNLDEVEP